MCMSGSERFNVIFGYSMDLINFNNQQLLFHLYLGMYRISLYFYNLWQIY